MLFKSKNKVSEIEVSQIRANPDQPRKIFERKELEELSNSIREFGVIQPIVVKRAAEGKEDYFLIAGERRLRAAKMAGLAKIPAIIREADEKDLALIPLVENVQRENLNYLEEAAAYYSLMEDYGLTQSEISRRVGQQQSTISNKIRLLSLPPELREALSKNQLTERHARAWLKIPDNESRKQILDKIVLHNLNVKQSEKLIDDFLEKRDRERKRGEQYLHINYKIYVSTIKKAYESIREAEKQAKYFQEDKGDFLEIRIVIPKKAG